MTSTSQKAVRPGEIKISLIPIDWPLTPLGPNKDPYTHGWQLKPFTITEIEDELASDCWAVLSTIILMGCAGLMLTDRAYSVSLKKQQSSHTLKHCHQP